MRGLSLNFWLVVYTYSYVVRICTHLHTKSHTTSCFLRTCGGDDGLAHQADAGTVASQHGDVVVLPARQVGEVAVGVVAVALCVVAEASPGVHCVRCGTTRRVPGDHGDSGLAVDSCGEVSGNAGRWWGGKWRWHTF